MWNCDSTSTQIFWKLPEDQREEVRAFSAEHKKKRAPKGKDGTPTKKQKQVSSAVAKQAKVMEAMAKTLAQTQAALSSLSVQSSKNMSLEAAVGAVSIEDTPSKPKNNTAQLILANASALKL